MAHIRVYSSENLHVCDIFQSAYPPKDNLEDSVRHDGEGSYICSACNTMFTHKNDLDVHFRMHTSENHCVCEICMKGFADEESLLDHLILFETHDTYNVYENLFADKHTSFEHFRHHVSIDLCQKEFNNEPKLNQHSKLHTGEKPYVCTTCYKAFKHKHHLKQHSKVHTVVKSYVCNVCEKEFKYKSYLIRHSKMHTGENPYVCDECQKTFNLKTNLIRHLRVHTGEKPYVCPICQKAFTQKNDLNVHSRLHIGD